MTQHYSILIVGSGIMGLSLAKALADQSFHVALVDQKAPDINLASSGTTSNVIALNTSSCHLLKNIGLHALFPSTAATAFRRLHTWDEHHQKELIFDAKAIQEPSLGYITEKRAITNALWKQIEQEPLIDLYLPYHPKAIETTETDITLTLDDGKKLSAPLLIGSDGAHSWVRRFCRIPTSTRSYHHQALSCVIETEKPLKQTAWQAFTSSGPLGILPLNHPHQGAIVWSMPPQKAKQYTESTTDYLDQTLTHLLSSHLGSVRSLTPIHSVPLLMRHAQRYTDHRVALIGDAAHTLHPLAGQGANLGFCDIAALVDTLTPLNHDHIGSQDQLNRYQQARKTYNTQMSTMMRLLKDCLGTPSFPLSLINQVAFSTLNALPPLKNRIIRYATLPQAGHLMRPHNNNT